MPGVVRLDDDNGAGGKIIAGIDSVLVNNKPICVDGKPISPHAPWGRPHPPHDSPVTTGGLRSVIAGGIPINIIGNPDTCGHSRAEGSGDVVAG